MSTIHHLGEGILDWHKQERSTDRWGTVRLNEGRQPIASGAPVGATGTLTAVVITTARTVHSGIGAPTSVGERVILGNGELFTQQLANDGHSVGVKPAAAGERDWMDSTQLARVHSHKVRLEFTPN